MCSRTWISLVVAAGITVVIAAGGVFAMGASSKEPSITIEAQEARLSPAMLGVASVFMKIVNAGGSDRLAGAKVDIKDVVVELHDVKDRHMNKVDSIKIRAGGVTEFKPGSIHIMLFNLPKHTMDGQKFTLTLVFERAGEKQVLVEFKGSDNGHMMHHGGH